MQRRVVRKRPAASGLNEIFDDQPLPAWRDLPGNDDGGSNESEIAELAATLEAKYYPRASLKFWPKDFRSRAGQIEQQDKVSFRKIYAKIQEAVTAYLINELGELELKLMLFVMNRTLKWSKFWEAVPYSHATEGVFIKQKLIQARLTVNKTHFIGTVEDLIDRKLIREDVANSESGEVRVLSINIRGVLDQAQSVVETTTKPTFGQWKRGARFKSG